MTRMPRPQDILFGLWCLMLAGLLVLHVRVVVAALVGAFLCGSLYIFAGMIPPASESFGRRVFTSVFLAVVLSSVILILPGTLGARALRHEMEDTVAAIAAVPPVAAIFFEVFRTPRVVRTILHWLGYD